jgi:hypothetical protein
MRLLNTRTLQLEAFFDDQIPPYAILSHTWGDGEITFQDIQHLDVAREKEGFHKVERACALAASEGHDFIWIDTCCIDKSSSAELSEAINSMYQWYRQSAVCYAYLIDVDDHENVQWVDEEEMLDRTHEEITDMEGILDLVLGFVRHFFLLWQDYGYKAPWPHLP